MRALAILERDAYITTYQSYVTRLATRVLRQYGLPKCMLEDLVAAGHVGLVEAASRYKSSKNNKFTSYAFYRIRGAIIDEVRRMGSSTVSYKRAYKTIKVANEIFNESRDDAEATTSNLQLAGILDALSSAAMAYQLTGSEQVESISDEQFEEKLNNQVERQFLESLIQQLSLRQQQVIRSYYFQDMNYTEIARRYKISSKSWVSKLHFNALRNIKKLYEEEKSK